MAVSRSSALVNLPRQMRFDVISAKNRSTMFSHDALVGVKRWSCFFDHSAALLR